MQSMVALWVWCNANSLHAYIAIAVLGSAGFVFNAVVRIATPRWPAFVVKHPRIAGLLLIFKGAFPEGGTIARGFMTMVKGALVERASGAPAKPLPAFPILTIIREHPAETPDGPPPPPAGVA